MPYLHWQHFLAIESDLEATTRFVEFSQRNFKTYSIEFARILLSSASEVDVVAKALCKKINPKGKFKNIDDYRRTITSKYGKFSTLEVSLSRYGLQIKPWEDWAQNNNPSWWKSYNEVKHQRDTYFEKANLENALFAVGGLFAFVLYYYHEDLRNSDFFWPSFPKLMLTPEGPDLLRTGDWRLPDFS